MLNIISAKFSSCCYSTFPLYFKGRGGKGSVYVWANGNGGPNDDCGADGYALSPYTISVGALGVDGFPSPFDEVCSAKLVTAYVTNAFGNSAVVSKCYFIDIFTAKESDIEKLKKQRVHYTDVHICWWRMHSGFWWDKCSHTHGLRSDCPNPRC